MAGYPDASRGHLTLGCRKGSAKYASCTSSFLFNLMVVSFNTQGEISLTTTSLCLILRKYAGTPELVIILSSASTYPPKYIYYHTTRVNITPHPPTDRQVLPTTLVSLSPGNIHRRRNLSRSNLWCYVGDMETVWT